MKAENNIKYKISLEDGTLYMTRGSMGAVLIEKKLQMYIVNKNYEGLGWELLYGWSGYQSFTDDELIDEIYEYFTETTEIKELLDVQHKRLKKEHEQWKKWGLKELEEIQRSLKAK